MSSFFESLKSKRDFSDNNQQTQENISSSRSSFFSNLKQKRELPREKLVIDEFEEKPTSFRQKVKETYKDIAEQGAVGLTSGLGGAYGNVFSLLGINPEEGYINPGEKAKYEMESQILDKMSQPGYKPSLSDLYSLTDDDISPQFSRLPTSQEISRKIEELGGPSEAKTSIGGATRRASEIFGAGAALGATGILPAVAGGASGEIAKQLGGGPLIQTVSEILGMLGPSSIASLSKTLTSTNPAVQARINALKNIGYTDKEITLAINAEKAGSNAVKRARATSGSEKSFSEALAKSEGLFSDVLEKSLPGYQKGIESLHEAASDSYGRVAREGRGIKIHDSERFEKVIDNVKKELRKTLGETPEAEPFIKRLNSAAEAAQVSPTAEHYVNFYKELNAMGNWLNPSKKEKLISHVKNGIKSTFRNSGKEGKQFAEKFEQVNKGVTRAYDAEAVNKLLEKGATQEGIDWKKTLKLFDKNKNWEILEKGLGKEQAKNLHTIAKTAKDIGDFEKALGSKFSSKKFDSISGKLPILGLIWSAIEHNPKYAIGSFLIKGGTSLGKNITRRLQTKLLTDPKFQNISIKALNALKEGSPQAAQRAISEFEKYAQEEGIDLP